MYDYIPADIRKRQVLWQLGLVRRLGRVWHWVGRRQDVSEFPRC